MDSARGVRQTREIRKLNENKVNERLAEYEIIWTEIDRGREGAGREDGREGEREREREGGRGREREGVCACVFIKMALRRLLKTWKQSGRMQSGRYSAIHRRTGISLTENLRGEVTIDFQQFIALSPYLLSGSFFSVYFCKR